MVKLFDGAERDRALGIWSALGGGGAALGVLLGGLLTAGPGWSWVFFVNVPVGVLLALSLHRVLPPDADGRSPGRLDLLGAALVTAATGTLIYALIQAGDRGWTSAATGLLAVVAAALYLAFVIRMRRATHRLMDLGLLPRRPVAVGTLLVLVATALMITVFFLGSFYFQRHLGYDALRTGLLFLPVALATTAGATIAGRRGSGDPEDGGDARPDVAVRPATAADVPAIARIWREGWVDRSWRGGVWPSACCGTPRR